MVGQRLLLVMSMVFACVLGACGAPITAQSEHFRITMTLEQEGLGKRPVMVTLVDQSGNPVDNAIITLLPVMRQHGMLAPPLTVHASQSGEYLFPDVNLDMSGEWQMQITIVVGTTTDLIEIPVIIE